MVARLKELNPQAVENHEYREAWVFDYGTMFQVLTENPICRKVCEKIPKLGGPDCKILCAG